MTLEQFVASGRDVDDLGVEHPGMDLDGVAGRIYGGRFGPYVERFDGGEGWYLPLGNCEYVEPLADLERRLYEYAAAEQMI